MGWIIGRGNSFIFRQGGGKQGQTYWTHRTIAKYFDNGFSGANILDSSGNDLHAISRNTGSFVGNGTAYFAVTGLLTTDIITALSTDVPTCTINGRLDIANGDIIYGVTITRSGVLWAYYPVCEKMGACLHDVSGNGRHGTMTTGSDANWQVVDLPTMDYLRDNGGSRVPYIDNSIVLSMTPLVSALVTDSWEIEFNYKYNNLAGTYLIGGDSYINRVGATTLRLRISATSIDFTIAVPLFGNMKISYNGTDTFTCVINGVSATASNSKALDGFYYIGTRNTGYASMNGYIRDFKFTKNSVLLVNIPDIYDGHNAVTNQKVISVSGVGTLSYYMVPSNQAKTLDADGFTITHPQNGHQAIPGTYFSLPADADLITACGNVTINTYYTAGVPNIMDAGAIGHYDPKFQYYDWFDRDNLIIVKDGVTITDANDLTKIKELHYWGTYIAEAFAADNTHIPTSDLDHYKSTLETLLHPNYTDSATTGYYYSTFGPEGLKRTDCIFFIIFFHNGDITAAALSPFNVAQLTSTPRLNVGGDIYDSTLFSNHVYTNDYIILSSVDNWKSASSVVLNMTGTNLIRNIQNFVNHISLMLVTLSTNPGLYFDITNFPHRSNLQFDYTDTQVYGTFPSSLIHSNRSILLKKTGITKFAFTSITNNIENINISNAPILSSEMDRLFAMLNTCFTANAPTKTLTITLLGYPTGYLTDGVLNTDYVNIKALFTAAGKTLTLNEDWLLDKPTALNEPSIVITHDDWYIQNQNLLSIYVARGIKPTCYCTTSFLTSEYVYEGDAARWGKVASWTEANNLRINYGWDMQCHGYVHGNIDAASMILADADHLSHFGVTPSHIAYPSGAYNDAMIAEINPTYRLTGRRASTSDVNIKSSLNGKNTNLMKLGCVSFDSTGEIKPTSDFARLKYSMDVIAEDSLNMIILIHGVPEDGTGRDSTIAQITELLDYAISKGIAIKTMKEFYDEDLV